MLFFGCQNLESVNSEVEGFVDLSNFVTGSTSYMFMNCKKIKQVKMSKMSVTSWANEQYMFNNCDSLEYVDIGNPGNLIGSSNTLQNCPKLTSTVIRSTTKITYSNIWTGTTDKSKITIYVPSNLLASYLADTNWTGAGFAGIEAIADTFTIDGTTYNCDEGETFTTWIASENNTIGVHFIGDTVFNSDNTAYLTKNNIAIIQSNVVSGEYTWVSL